MKKRYGKLVRDNIPEIIRNNGELPNIREMDTDEYRRELLYKLIEEAEEVRQAGYDPTARSFIAELADLSEVLEAVMKEFNINGDELIETQRKRREERGGFEGRVFLESVQ